MKFSIIDNEMYKEMLDGRSPHHHHSRVFQYMLRAGCTHDLVLGKEWNTTTWSIAIEGGWVGLGGGVGENCTEDGESEH